MKSEKKNEKAGLFKGVVMAYTILVLHVLLIAGVGCLIIFFRGITEYMAWILVGCSALIIFSGYYFYRRMKEEGRSLRDTLNSPMFSGRNVEISVLGGFASLKIGTPNHMHVLEGSDRFEPFRQLEDPAVVRIRELKTLAQLLEDNLITPEEYNQSKRELFNN
jgi:hypothetical protein